MNKKAFLKGLGKAALLALLFLSYFTIAEEIASTQANAPVFAIVSPFSGDTVKDSMVVIIKPENPEAVSKASLRLTAGGFEKEITESNNWIADWNSKTVPDGPYAFTVEVCSAEACSNQSFEVIVSNQTNAANEPMPEEKNLDSNASGQSASSEDSNQPKQPDESQIAENPTPTPKEQSPAESQPNPSDSNNSPPALTGFKILASNYLSAFYLRDAQSLGVLYSSSGDALQVPEGIYNAKLEFFNLPLKEIIIPELQVSQDLTVASLKENLAKENLEFEGKPLKPDGSIEVSFGQAVLKAGIALSPGSDFLLYSCNAWDSAVEKCSEGWKPLESTVVEFSGTNAVFAWAKKPEQQDQNTVPVKFWVSPANIPASLTLQDLKGNQAALTTGSIEVEQGTYNAELVFGNHDINTVLTSIEIDHNGMLVEFFEFDSNALSTQSLTFNKAFGLSTSFQIRDGFAVYARAFSESLYSCLEWDINKNTCIGEWQSISEIKLSAGLNVFAIAESIGKPARKKIGKRILSLQKKNQAFSANDSPSLEVSLTAEDGTEVDENITAFLTFPDGHKEHIDSNNVKKLKNGKFSIEVQMPRSFKAGNYSITVQAISDNNSIIEETTSFDWGLIAVNTRKSIYKPEETAEFEIVVLDKESFGVRGASISMQVQLPSGRTETLSTVQGSVIETTSEGIYIANYVVSEEGEYNVKVEAQASGINTSIQTSFQVSSDFAFDILRRTGTKIDPAGPSQKVMFEITSFKGVKKADITEKVPKEFEISIDNPNVKITNEGNEKTIKWKDFEFDSEGKALIEYDYRVPDKKPWLYLLGPLEIKESETESFFEARSWMIAVDVGVASKLYFRTPSDLNNVPRESMPNDANCSTGCGVAAFSYSGVVPDTNGISDIAGTSTVQSGDLATNAITAYFKFYSFTSPPLIAQTITTNGTFVAYIGCDVSTATSNTPRPAFAIYRWINATDSNGQRITNLFGSPGMAATSPCVKVTGLRGGSTTGKWASITFNRGDKIVVEADVNKSGSATGATIFFVFNNASAPNDGNVTLPSGVTLTFAGDLNTGVIYPANDSNQNFNTAFDVNALGSCNNYSCSDTNVQLQYCMGAGCSNFVDMNAVAASPLYVSTGAAVRKDVLLDAGDTNYFKFQVTGTQAGNYTIRSKIDSNQSADVNNSGTINADVGILVKKGTLSHDWFNPGSDANTYTIDTTFIVNAIVRCNDQNCGAVDTNLQYCFGASCNAWMDLNNAAGSPLQLTSGSIPDQNTTGLIDGQTYDVNWIVQANTLGTYELRLRSTGTKSDTNQTVGTDRTVTVQGSADYTFALFLPSSNCTNGKGRIDAGNGACQKGYFETTDLSGTADQNKVDPEGQDSSTPFFVYDNQSTASNDMNFTLDLNQALPANLTLKVSQIYNGWAWICTQFSDNNCVFITTSSQNIGKAGYTAGQQDLNVFVWGDFNGAGVGRTDRNVTHTSEAS